MVTSEFALPSVQSLENPRPVSRGSNIQLGFLGIDSMYVVLEYPHTDIFLWWFSLVPKINDSRLYSGIPYEDFLIKIGGNGYKISVWDGDARLFLTDRVNDQLRHSTSAGQGMGVMLQVGPKWLRRFGDIAIPQKLIGNVFAQLKRFGIEEPLRYPARLNRIDINLDVLGLNVADFSIDEWRNNWVGHARQKNFHDSSLTGQLEGFSIGSSEGAIRFKVYDKVAESRAKGTYQFWQSVWGILGDYDTAVARFEWSIRPYSAQFVGMQYLTDLRFEGFVELLNYASLSWGRLCTPDPNDSNKARWELAPIWQVIRRFIEDWSDNYPNFAKREYEYRPDLKPTYLRSLVGWLGGFMARLGVEQKLNSPADVVAALEWLAENGLSIKDSAGEKWEVLSRLAGEAHHE